jgi:hypothetical protein
LNKIRRIIAVLAVAALIPIAAAWGVEEATEEDASSANPTDVVIDIEHGIELPWGKPGFRITMSKWAPHGDVVVAAIGPEGETIELVPKEKPLKAGGNGEIVIDIDYEREGLGPGYWLLAIAGEPGFHVVPVEFPRVEPPTEERDSWRLVFGETSEEE